MPANLSLSVIARIEDALREADDPIPTTYILQIAHDFDTTARTVYRHLTRIRANCPVARKSGGPHILIS